MQVPAGVIPALARTTTAAGAQSRRADRCRDPARRAAYEVGVSEQYSMLNRSPRYIAGGSLPAPGPRNVDFGLDHGGEVVTRVVP